MPKVLSASARASSIFFSPTSSVRSSFSKIDVFAHLNVNRLIALSDISTLECQLPISCTFGDIFPRINREGRSIRKQNNAKAETGPA